MMLDRAIAAAERTETARRLIAQAQVDVVDLVVLSALDLCVLDGPRQPVFEQRVATQACMQVTERRRRKVTEEVTAGLVRRGLLIDGAPQHHSSARWTINPPAQPGDGVPVRYLVSAYRPDPQHPVGYQLGVRGDGIRAVVDGPSIGSAQSARYDLEGLRGIMLDLLTRASR